MDASRWPVMDPVRTPIALPQFHVFASFDIAGCTSRPAPPAERSHPLCFAPCFLTHVNALRLDARIMMGGRKSLSAQGADGGAAQSAIMQQVRRVLTICVSPRADRAWH